MRTPAFLLLALLLPSGATPLAAEDIRLEAQIGTAIPSGTLRTLVDSRAGFVLGASALLDFLDGHAVRPSLEVMRWKGTRTVDFPVVLPEFPARAAAAQTTQIQSWRLGADYLYFLQGTTDLGPYALGGVALAWNRRSADLEAATPGLSGSASLTQHHTQVAWNLGAGYQFSSRFGLEAAYHGSSLRSADLPLPLAAGAANTQVNVSQEGGSIGHWSLRAIFRF